MIQLAGGKGGLLFRRPRAGLPPFGFKHLQASCGLIGRVGQATHGRGEPRQGRHNTTDHGTKTRNIPSLAHRATREHRIMNELLTDQTTGWNTLCKQGFWPGARRERGGVSIRILNERATTPQAKRPFARRVAAILASAFVARQLQIPSDMLLPRASSEAKLAATECILSCGLVSNRKDTHA